MSTKKIIAISANTCWYLYNFEKNLILQMQNHDYHVIAIAPADEYKSKLKSLGCDYLDLALSRCGRNPFVDIKTIFAFYTIYKKHKPTLALHFSTKNNIYGTLASWLLNIPAINTISGLGTVFLEKSFSKFLLIMLYKISQSKAYKVIFQNLETKNIFINHKILSTSKAHLLPGCGVDLDYFAPIKRNNDDKIIFLLLARMIYDKGITEFVAAAKNLIMKYPQAKFQLLGFIDNSHPNKISIDTIKNWQSQNYIEYLGSTTDVRDYIAQADVIVLPSYSEGLPRSLMEAAAMQKPL